MALSLRLRRALSLSASVLKDPHLSSISSPPPLLCARRPHAPLSANRRSAPHSLFRAQSFRSSPVALSRRFDRRHDDEEPKIGPDDILFEGCDYNHWLITIDFPREPENRPSPEEMVRTYEETAAKVFGSLEEAKKRIYACSTTTYQGFQVLCDEETSEKFRGLPGVVFILPDSYIDPVNKEYGGDKYENGIITHRPPPIQHTRQSRFDRNRNQTYYVRPRDSNPAGTMQGGRGYGPPPQDGRGYGPPRQDGRGYGPPPQDVRGYGPPPQDGRGYGPPAQDGRGFQPPPQDGRGFVAPPQDGRGFQPPPQDGRGFGAPPQDGRGFGAPPQDGRGFGPSSQDGGFVQGEQRDQTPPYQGGFNQGHQGNFPPHEQQKFAQGPGGPGFSDYRQPAPPSGNDNRQGPNPGFSGGLGHGQGAGDYKQGQGFGHGPGSLGPVDPQWQGRL